MLLLTAAEMKALDEETIRSGRASGETLMERAGAGVVEAMERRYGPALGMRVLVLSGTGNNGGDGFVAARHLIERGADVTAGVAGDPSAMRGDARTMLERLVRAGVTPEKLESEPAIQKLIATRGRWDFALDAILGTGARGAPEGLAAAAVQALRELDDRGTRVVAVDLPTGVSADTGAIARRAVRADLTVTFGHPKRAHVLYPGRAFTGMLEVVDIGLSPAGSSAECYPFTLGTPGCMAQLVPVRDPRAHKGTAGRVVVVGGSVGLTGAVALAARAATRTGAGYVQCAIPASLNDVLAVKLTEEMTLPFPDTGQRAFALESLDPILERAQRAHAVVLGSGLSRHPEPQELARGMVARCARPMVVDADALFAFSGSPVGLSAGGAPRVVTPHIGEAARLSGMDAAAIEDGRLDLARQWAKEWRVVVVLKGAPTVIASPEGLATVSPTGNPGMATAGMGDVLSGVIAALLAQGLEAYDAARLGAFAHGMAGDLAAAARGSVGIAAGDVAELMPRALQDLARLREERPTSK